MIKLDKRVIETILPLTPTQEGMLYHFLHSPDGDQYNEHLYLNITGQIKLENFSKAWALVIQTNEMLRTIFRWEKLENATQIVLKQHEGDILFYDLSDKPNHQKSSSLKDIHSKNLQKVFNLKTVPFRIVLCKLTENTFQMIISNHHILYDGWSTGIILKEFFENYKTLENNQLTQLIKPSTKTPFKEFINWIRKQDEGSQKQYWQNYLAGFDTPAILPIKRRNEDTVTNQTQNITINIDSDLAVKIKEFLKYHHFTLATLFYTSWGILLQQYCNTEDIVFGTTVSGRSAKIKSIGEMVGLFINTIPLRINHPYETQTIDLLQFINETLKHHEFYEHTPLVKIRENSQLGANEELFDTLMVIENYPLETKFNQDPSSINVTSYSALEKTNYPLTIAIVLGKEIVIHFMYNKNRFVEKDIKRSSLHFTNILKDMLKNPGKKLYKLDMLSHDEKQQILIHFNETEFVGFDHKTLQSLFYEQAKQNQEQVALADKSTILTYNELHKKSGQLAHFLKKQGIVSETLIGLLTDRTHEMIIGILGILFVGCGYVPINPKTPETRLRYILDECGVRAVLTNYEITGFQQRIKTINLKSQKVYINDPLPFQPSHPDSLAYVIYTSGSTGKPKGVPITHTNLMPLLKWGKDVIAFGPKDRVIQNLSYYFDWSVWEIFMALTVGASLYMISPETLLDSNKYVDFINRHNITVLHIPPTQFQGLIQWGRKLSTLKYLCLGAEKLTQDLVNRSYELVDENCRLFNMYGPTEATIISSVLEIQKYKLPCYEKLSSIPIGKTVGNTILLILNRAFNICPLHIPGELFIGGEALAKGYLNNPELTAEKFLELPIGNNLDELVSDSLAPHSLTQLLAHSTFYRTGDQTRWLPEGIVEFLGRIDFQCKIRGYRIEPGEIEKYILELQSIRETAVIAREAKNGEKYLCAYIVPVSALQLNTTEQNNNTQEYLITQIKKHLSNQLPEYMVPAHYVILEKIPLNPNGKADRNALPEPVIKSYRKYTAPTTQTEKLLIEIWSELLGIEKHKISVLDNFFELGGHSLKATALMAKIHKTVNAEISLKKIFETPTIKELAQTLEQLKRIDFDAILPIEQKEYYLPSSAQKRLFVLQKMAPLQTHYNISGGIILEGDINEEILEHCIKTLISRHESLRTSFITISNRLVQRIHRNVDIKIEKYTLAKQEDLILNTKKNQISVPINNANDYPHKLILPFDLSETPLLRVALIIISPKQSLLLVDMHHIISDGISIEILVRELKTLYSGKPLPPIEIQYKDYSEKQNSLNYKEKITLQKKYWQTQFSHEIPILQLPTDFTRPPIQSFAGDTKNFRINKEIIDGLIVIAQREGVTLFTLFLSLFNLLLFKLTGQEDIVVGNPIAGRHHIDLNQTIGMFVNTLALRSYPASLKTYTQFLAEVKENVLNAFENQDFPFEDLVDLVELERNASRNPIFDVMLVFQNIESNQNSTTKVKLKPISIEKPRSKFDLTLTIEELETNENFCFKLTYNTDLFQSKTIIRYIDYFKQLCKGVVNNPEETIAKINILSQYELKQILDDFNSTTQELPGSDSILDLFQNQVKKTPHNIAVVGNERTTGKQKTKISYEELNRKSIQLAYILKQHNATTEKIIGIMTEPGIEMIIGILSVIYVGGTYLPIDPTLPPERINYMLEDSRANLLLTTADLSEKLTLSANCQQLLFEDTFILKNSDQKITSTYNPDHIIYTIYTSGTTGKSKGTLIENKNLTNYIQWFKKKVAINDRDRTVLTSSFGFDLGYTIIYSSLLSGSQLHMIPREMYLSAEELLEYINTNEITYFKMTPSLFSALIGSSLFTKNVCTNVRLVVLGGEAIKLMDVEKAHSLFPHIVFMNHYGPTEATIGCVAQLIDFNLITEYKQHPTIGTPIDNMKVFILSICLQPVPIKTPGELCVSGSGVARGYLNHPELTAERFVKINKNTVQISRRNNTIRCNRIYKTGDMARWLFGGTIEFLGRKDNQVKIRGYRIENSEIEHHLVRHHAVKEAVVVHYVNSANNFYLCAYIVWKEIQPTQTDIRIQELRQFLSIQLPDYMIPAYFITLESIPLTPNGKLNKKQLPEPQIQQKETNFLPRNPIEKKLADIWNAVLRNDLLSPSTIGIDDNFFRMGGNSLTAINLISKIDKEFHLRIPLGEIFKTPTIKGIGQYIQNKKDTTYYTVQSIEKREYYLLSSAQKRLFILQQMEGINTSYNMPYVSQIEGEIDKKVLEDTFISLIRRHESLRTSFEMLTNEPVQRIHDNVGFRLGYSTARESNDNDKKANNPEKLTQNLVTAFVQPFDLSNAPLLRVGIFNSIQNETIFIVDMHHIISDGISRQILLKEFMELLAGKGLPKLKIQYKDFAQWQNNQKIQNNLIRQKEFWQKEFAGEIPLLDIPIDFPRPAIQSFSGDTIPFEINQTDVQVLNELALTQGTTLFMVLLGIYYIFLSKLSTQENILVGIPTMGRGHADLAPVIGMFVNTLVLQNFPIGEKIYTDFLLEIKNRSLQAFENQDYQYEELVEDLGIEREASRNPLFDTMFSLLSINIPTLTLPGLQLIPRKDQIETAKFDLSLVGVETENRIQFKLEYSTALFKKKTIERYVHYFKQIVSTITHSPGIKISEIQVISLEEKHQLLFDFNNTTSENYRKMSMYQLFGHQVEKNPDYVALVEINKGHKNFGINYQPPYIFQLSYREFNNKIDILSQILIKKGIQSDTLVGLMVERSIVMMIGIFSILKIGGAYLPIAPDYPQERITYMLTESNVGIILTTSPIATDAEVDKNTPRQQSNPLQVIQIAEENFFKTYQEPPAYSEISPFKGKSGTLIYVIYTSGSTGKPKGAVVTSESFVNLLYWFNTEFQINNKDRFLLIAPISFDLSQKNLYSPLIVGGTLVLPPPGLPDYVELSETLFRMQISVLNCAPSVFYPLMELNSNDNFRRLIALRYLFLGGEPIQGEQLAQWVNSSNYRCQLVNTYGPSECTDIATSYCVSIKEIREKSNIPIGHPIYNVSLFVLDRHFKLVPIGVTGELCIGGAGISWGYMNNPEKTAEKFFSWTSNSGLPQHSSNVNLSEKIYMTGDVASWNLEGNVFFHGRVDNQVKIRGNRIELGEIENRLIENKAVANAIVDVRKDIENNNYLCAYLVPAPGIQFDQLELKNYLSQVLPDYMIPSFFLQIERFPLTPSGKVDRKALPKPELNKTKTYTAPRNQLEKKLSEIWWEVLGKDTLSLPPGIDDNFFHLGGHSLKATILISKIYKSLEIKIPLSSIFKTPTIRGISQLINSSLKEKYESIEHVELMEYYPLSPAQKRLVLLHQLIGLGTGYNITSLLKLEGTLKKEKLNKSFKHIIQRHGSYRTSIPIINGEHKQRIYDHVEFSIEEIHPEIEKESENFSDNNLVITKTIQSFIRPFNLSQAPLLRVGVMKIQDNLWLLLVDMHHIIADGYSMNIVINDFITVYNEEREPAPSRYSYSDYTLWQDSQKAKKLLTLQEEYWLNEYNVEIPILELPYDYKRPSIQSFLGNRVQFIIEKDEVILLKNRAIDSGGTLFMILLSILYVLLSKLSGQEEIIVGVPVAGRKHADLHQIVGVFINTLPIKCSPKNKKTFKEFFEEVQEKTLAAFEHQDHPFEDLVEKLKITRNPGRNPLFDIMFTLQSIDTTKLKENKDKTIFTPYDIDFKTSKFDITFVAQEVEEYIECSVEYCTQLFNNSTINRIINYYKHLISILNQTWETQISSIEILSPEEKSQLIVEFNREDKQFPTNKTTLQLFTRQIEKNPHQIALVGENSRQKTKFKNYITYHQLEEISLQLANFILDKNENLESLIGLMTERSIEMIIGILAIWQVGCGYVPLNPKAPWARNRYILNECKVKILITNCEAEDLHHEFEKIDFKDFDFYSNKKNPSNNAYKEIPKYPLPSGIKTKLTNNQIVERHDSEFTPAYVIFTSGSTGKPKGVPISHFNFTPLLHWGYKYLPLNCRDRSVQNLSYYFDWSVWEIFITLTSGATLYMINEEIMLNPIEYLSFIRKNDITNLHITPTQFQSLINWSGDNNPLKTLKYLAIGAEKLTYNLVKRSLPLLKTTCRIYNMYGPTEATIMSAVLLIDREKIEGYKELSSIPIGKPTANLNLFIFDRNGNIVPLNVVGELFISGRGVAVGYLNNVELTAEKFQYIPGYHPFNLNKEDNSNSKTKNNELTEIAPLKKIKVYKTGDMARWVSDGTVEFLGRVDFQVKIRGYRIELGEIENCLLNQEQVKDALVIDKEKEDGEKYLCAYIVPQHFIEDENTLTPIRLRNLLSQDLPDYMIPSAFVFIQKIPLNPNGKVDLTALPQPEHTTAETYTPPRNSLEKKLQDIWQNLLKLEKISIHDDFFSIGGHSLKMLNLVNAIEKEIQVKINFQDFFQSPTIAELAAFINRSNSSGFQSIKRQSQKEYYELSYPQKRLWLLYQLEPENPAFNLPSRITLNECVQESIIRKTLTKLIERHESFRTYLKIIKGQVSQIIQSQITLDLEIHDLTTIDKSKKEEIRAQLFREESQKPFKLEQPPLFRTKLIRCEPNEFDIILTMHHIITDGWSMELLGDEFLQLYNTYKSGTETQLTPLYIRYIDFVYWQKELLGDNMQIQKAREFWETQLKGEILPLELPYDIPRKKVNSTKSAAFRMVIPNTILSGLKKLAQQQKASLFMVLLAGFNILLQRISGQSDILLGVPGAARQHENLKNIVGFFVNTLILRNEIEKQESFVQFLSKVQSNMLKVLEYQSFPLELICSEYKIKYPEISVFLNFLTFGSSKQENPDTQSEIHIPEVQDTKFDITCYLDEYNDGMTISTHYFKDLFHPQSIEKIMKMFLVVLKNISCEPEKKICEYTYDLSGKKRQLKAW